MRLPDFTRAVMGYPYLTALLATSTGEWQRRDPVLFLTTRSDFYDLIDTSSNNYVKI